MIDEIKRIAQLIEERSGINIDSIGEANFQKNISVKMKKLGIVSPKVYYFKLVESASDFQELIEELVVPETWFFRDPASFAFLQYYVTHDLLPSLKFNRRINFLSVACSSGEEPYSIAIQMLEAGLKPDQFSIDAIDISKVALKKAKEGVYTSYSFRGMAGTDSRFTTYFDIFENRGHLFKIKKNIKKYVNFYCENVLDETHLPHENYYDVIFCKNLLIYMMPPAQQQLLINLNKILLDPGHTVGRTG